MATRSPGYNRLGLSIILSSLPLPSQGIFSFFHCTPFLRCPQPKVPPCLARAIARSASDLPSFRPSSCRQPVARSVRVFLCILSFFLKKKVCNPGIVESGSCDLGIFCVWWIIYFIYLSSYLYPTESITRILFQISVFVQLNLGERYRKQCMDIGIKTCNHLIAWCGRFHIPIQFGTFGQRIGPD